MNAELQVLALSLVGHSSPIPAGHRALDGACRPPLADPTAPGNAGKPGAELGKRLSGGAQQGRCEEPSRNLPTFLCNPKAHPREIPLGMGQDNCVAAPWGESGVTRGNTGEGLGRKVRRRSRTCPTEELCLEPPREWSRGFLLAGEQGTGSGPCLA